jgi:hypothetical protein
MSRSLFLLPLAVLLVLPWTCCNKPRIENVLLISMDTTRADYVDSGRGGRAWTPELRRFAAGAWVFDNAYSPIPQTLPAHLAVLSGRLPHELGVFGNECVYDGRYPMLQQVLQRRGWRTVGIVSLGTLAAATGIARGFDHYYDQLNDGSHFYAPAEKVTEAAIGQLERFKQSKFFLFAHYSDPHSPYAPPKAQAPFTIEFDGRSLLTFNAYSGVIARLRLQLTPGRHKLRFRTEAPAEDFDSFIIRRLQAAKGMRLTLENLEYTTEYYGGSHLLRRSQGTAVIHARSAGELRLFQVIPILTQRSVLENYRGEVEYMDRQVGRLLSTLESSPAAKRTAVVLFADHGEGLGEREGFIGHVRFLNRQFIRVPLFVHFPGETPRRIEGPVSLQAVSSWLCDALGIEGSRLPRSRTAWSDLRRGCCDREPEYAFAFAPSAGNDLFSMILWPFQLIISRNPKTGAETREWYDLRMAAERQMDAIPPGLIMRQAPALWRQFETSRPLWQAAFDRSSQPPPLVSRRQIEKLKTLGYIRRP